jgi:hypothetical protein
LNADEFAKGCLQGVSVEEKGDLERFLQLAGANEDGEISCKDFCAAISPQRSSYGLSSSYYARDLSGREENKRSALGSLCELIKMVAKADIAILEARDGLDLPAEEIFNRMDYYSRGYIMASDLSSFLRNHVNFDVTEEQVARIHPYLDNRGTYYISKDNFMNATCAPHHEESEDMDRADEGEQEEQ